MIHRADKVCAKLLMYIGELYTAYAQEP